MTWKRWALVSRGLLLVAAALLLAPGRLLSQEGRRSAEELVDSIASAALAGGQAAGISVAVAREGRRLVLRGYGSADLELDVPTPVGAVYEIGSVTKQFTAAAMLQLAERGVLDLEDDVTDWLPDYPSQGRRVTLRRLLDHTSGIKGYTEIPEFRLLSIRRVPRDTLVHAFASKPFEFEPGEAAVYNNSAYYLLGLVIEKASGTSYPEYVHRNLFVPAGMSGSSYCSEERIIPGKVKGYDWTPEGLRHKGFIVHEHPYAAGSLCSTASDLVSWTLALHSGRILGEAAYRELLEPGTLRDGTRLRYAAGLSLADVHGHRAIHHSGGINGFRSDLAYLPDEDLVVAVLVNTGGPVSPSSVTAAIVDALVGRKDPPALVFRGRTEDYAGEYLGVGRGGELRFTVTEEDGALLGRVGAGGVEGTPLVWLGGETFALGSGRFTFERAGGRIQSVRADLVSGYSILRRR